MDPILPPALDDALYIPLPALGFDELDIPQEVAPLVLNYPFPPAPVNPPVDNPLYHAVQPVLPVFNMAKISLPKFSGLSTENAERFLLDFQSYSTLNQLAGLANDARKVAAFHLHLTGPALTWFNALPAIQRDTWEHLELSFNAQYVLLNAQNNPALVAEAELFAHMKLAPGQAIETFHSLVVEKGLRLQKQDRDLLIKFIEGLPQQLAFFVRAGHPVDHNAALSSAKMGEAYGYRVHTPVMAAQVTYPGPAVQRAPVSTSAAPPQSVLDEMRQQIQRLARAVEAMRMPPVPNAIPPRPFFRPRAPPYNVPPPGAPMPGLRPPGARPLICYRCNGLGHPQRLCNWTGQGQPRTDLTCTVCQQNGHSIQCCQLNIPPPVPAQPGN
jgi:hypothetical protein